MTARTNILFVTSTRVGDAILSTGLLDHLIREHPGASITVACGPAAAPLFVAVPGLSRVIVLEKMLFSLHWLRLWGLCVGTFWHRIVDLRNAPVTYLLARKRRYGMVRDHGGERRVQRLARVLGLDQVPAPKLWADDELQERSAKIIPAGSPVLAVGPTANWRAKTWRSENFADLIKRLTAPDGMLPNARVAVFGRDDERPTALGLLASIPDDRRIDLVGDLELLTGYACLCRCDFYVGNDSGLMHLAAAAGIPTLGLFGPTQEALYAPWGPHTGVVRTKVPFADIFPENFDHRSSGTLMDSLTVDMAEKGALDLWRRWREAA